MDTRQIARQTTTALTTLLHTAGIDTTWVEEADVTHVPGMYETNVYWVWQGIEDRGCSWREHYTADVETEEVRSIEDPADFIDTIREALDEGPIVRVEIGEDHLPMLMAGAIPIPVA